jgi:hypothetical protein
MKRTAHQKIEAYDPARTLFTHEYNWGCQRMMRYTSRAARMV